MADPETHRKDIEQIASMVIGQPIDRVRRRAEKAGWIIRVVRDGKKRYLGSCDVKANRINVAVDDGKVTQFAGVW